MLDGTICVECWATNPPRPDGFVVSVEGKTVAVLTLEKVQAALRRYGELERVAFPRRKGECKNPSACAADEACLYGCHREK